MKGTPVRRDGVTRHSFATTKKAAWTTTRTRQTNPLNRKARKRTTPPKRNRAGANTFANTDIGCGRIASRSAHYLRWLWWSLASNVRSNRCSCGAHRRSRPFNKRHVGGGAGASLEFRRRLVRWGGRALAVDRRHQGLSATASQCGCHAQFAAHFV